MSNCSGYANSLRIFMLMLASAWAVIPPAGADVDAPPTAVVHGGPIELDTGRNVTLVYDVEPPLKVNGEAPRRVWIGERRVRVPPGPAPVTLAVFPGDAQDGRLRVDTEYFVCEDRPGAPCFLRRVTFFSPVAQPGNMAPRWAVVLRTPPFPPPLPDFVQKN